MSEKRPVADKPKLSLHAFGPEGTHVEPVGRSGDAEWSVVWPMRPLASEGFRSAFIRLSGKFSPLLIGRRDDGGVYVQVPGAALALLVAPLPVDAPTQAPPAIVVNIPDLPAPVVNITMPEQPPPQVTVMPEITLKTPRQPRRTTAKRNPDGSVTIERQK